MRRKNPACSVDPDAPKPPASLLHPEYVVAFAPLSDLRLGPARRVHRWRARQRDSRQTDRYEIALLDRTSALVSLTVGAAFAGVAAICRIVRRYSVAQVTFAHRCGRSRPPCCWPASLIMRWFAVRLRPIRRTDWTTKSGSLSDAGHDHHCSRRCVLGSAASHGKPVAGAADLPESPLGDAQL